VLSFGNPLGEEGGTWVLSKERFLEISGGVTSPSGLRSPHVAEGEKRVKDILGPKEVRGTSTALNWRRVLGDAFA